MKFLRAIIVTVFFCLISGISYGSAFNQVYYEGGSNTYLQMGRFFALLHPQEFALLLNFYFSKTSQQIQKLPYSSCDGIYAVAWSPDGHKIVAGASDGCVNLYESKQVRRELNGHDGCVRTVAWHPDSRQIASGASDGKVYLWDVKKQSQCDLTAFDANVKTVAWDPSGKLLAIGTFDETSEGQICLWDVVSRRCKLDLNVESGVNAVAWDLHGKYLAIATADGNVRIWDWKEGKGFLLTGHKASVCAVAWSSDGERLASCSCDYSIRVLNVHTWKCERILNGHTNYVKTLAWMPDGKWLLSGALDHKLLLWHVETGLCVTMLTNRVPPFNSISISPDGNRVALGAFGDVLYILDDIQPYKLGHTFMQAIDSLSLCQQWFLITWLRHYKQWGLALFLPEGTRHRNAFNSLPRCLKELLLDNVIVLHAHVSVRGWPYECTRLPRINVRGGVTGTY